MLVNMNEVLRPAKKNHYAVGNEQGAYKLPPKLDFERIRTIASTVDVPLVIHGSSGLTDDDFRKAIKDGISKVNIFTTINVDTVKAEFEKFSGMDKGLIDLIPTAVEAVKQETALIRNRKNNKACYRKVLKHLEKN